MEEQREAAEACGRRFLQTGQDQASVDGLGCDCLHDDHAAKGVVKSRARNIESVYHAGSCASSGADRPRTRFSLDPNFHFSQCQTPPHSHRTTGHFNMGSLWTVWSA